MGPGTIMHCCSAQFVLIGANVTYIETWKGLNPTTQEAIRE